MFKTIIIIALIAALAWLARTLWLELGKKPAPTTYAPLAVDGLWVDGVFQNELDTPQMAADASYPKMLREMLFANNKKRRKPHDIMPSEKSELAVLAQQPPSIVWFGHSSYLLTLNGFTVLVDPVLAGHSAPLPFLVRSFKGTDVYGIDDLPDIDVLLITHDHYDHLDFETVNALKNKVKRVVAPLGVGAHLTFWGYDASKITELNWHESTVIEGNTFTATPARHFSGRGFERNTSLWASFVLQGAGLNLYLGGDSGYGPHFKAIGEQYGPFDLALIESGQYNEMWPLIHMQPEETVRAAQDLGTKVLMPVHWGKFELAFHDWDEPIMRVMAAAKASGQTMFTPTLGKPMTLNGEYAENEWWRSIQH